MTRATNWVEARLVKQGAVLHDGHFVLKSGLHACDYIDLDYMFSDLDFMQGLGRFMARKLGSWCDEVNAIVAPATGGVALLQHVANAVMERNSNRKMRVFWADKVGPKEFAIERADWAKQLKGLQVVGVEDVVSTGGSLCETLVQAHLAGAEVLGSMVVANRGNVVLSDLQKKYGLAVGMFLGHCFAVDFPTWDGDFNVCRMCQDGRPIHVDVGHGAQFARDNPDYPNKFDIFRK